MDILATHMEESWETCVSVSTNVKFVFCYCTSFFWGGFLVVQHRSNCSGLCYCFVNCCFWRPYTSGKFFMRLSAFILWFTFHLYPTPHKYSLFGTISFYFTAHYNNMTSLDASTVVKHDCALIWLDVGFMFNFLDGLSSLPTWDFKAVRLMSNWWPISKDGSRVSILICKSERTRASSECTRCCKLPILIYLSFMFTIWDLCCEKYEERIPTRCNN